MNEIREFFADHREYIGAATLAAVIVFILFLIDMSGYDQDRNLPDVSINATPITLAEKDNPFEHLTLEAKAAYVLDANTGTPLFVYNPDAQLPLASLTKIMTALTAQDIIPDETNIVIKRRDVETEGDSGLVADESWLRERLAAFMLLVSSNDAASALANTSNALLASNALTSPTDSPQSFVEAMNIKAKSLGLSQTFFVNPTGLDINSSVSGSYGSARDVAILIHRALLDLPETITQTSNESSRFFSQDNIVHNAQNTNSFVGSIPGIAASKTGFTPLAGGNLALIVDTSLNKPIIIVVLGSTAEGRFRDVLALVNATYIQLTSNTAR